MKYGCIIQMFQSSMRSKDSLAMEGRTKEGTHGFPGFMVSLCHKASAHQRLPEQLLQKSVAIRWLREVFQNQNILERDISFGFV